MRIELETLVKDLTLDEKEELAAGLLYEISEELRKEDGTKAIGGVIWGLMSKFREAYRTAKLCQKLK